jgi:hypothetical protein
MTLWSALLLACASTYAIKWLGHAVPARWLRSPRMPRVAGALTVALLASLTVMNTFANGTTLALDARLAALATAALALCAAPAVFAGGAAGCGGGGAGARPVVNPARHNRAPGVGARGPRVAPLVSQAKSAFGV